MQLDQQPPASEVVIPDKIDEEQDRGEEQKNEEEKKMDPDKIARLNIGSAQSRNQGDDSPGKLGGKSPSYSEFDQDKSPIAAVEIDKNASSSFINAAQNLKDMEKEDGISPGKDRYANESND